MAVFKKLKELSNGWELHPQAPRMVTRSLVLNLSQPTTFKIVNTGFLNKQILYQNATITAKPCLAIIACIFIDG